MNGLKVIRFILLACIFLGVLFRFIGLDNEYLWDDEQTSLISIAKAQHQSFFDGALYFQEHPPLGRWIQGLPTLFIDSDYGLLRVLGPNFFAWKHIALTVIEDTYVAVRLMNVLIGLLGLLFGFLIVKKLYGFDAALWTTALMSLSFDIIGYTRHEGLWKILSFSFSLGCLYFYILYLDYRQQDKLHHKLLSLGLSMLFLIMALGSRNFDPLFIMITLLACQFLLHHRTKDLLENFIFAALVGLCYAFVFRFLYPAPAQQFARDHLGVQSFTDLFGFTFIGLLKNVMLRNSLAFTFSFLLLLWTAFTVVKTFRADKKTRFLSLLLQQIEHHRLTFVLVLYALVSFGGLGFSKFGASPSYNLSLFAALFLLFGPAIQRLQTKRIVPYCVIFLLLISLGQLIVGFPYSVWTYSNLSLGAPFFSTAYEKDAVDSIIDDLAILGNPPLMTDNVNLLLFYPGQAVPLIVSQDPRCNENTFAQAKMAKANVVLKTNDPADQYICALYQTRIQFLKGFEGDGKTMGLYAVV